MAPFRVLVTEILLSKTRAEVVAPIAKTLLERHPHPADLAKAKLPELQQLLYPLGLYRKRAYNLVACAKALRDEHGGVVPSSVTELMRLPYVGRYAANAIACVAFDQPAAVLDANVSRIYQRVFSLPPPPERLALAHEFWRAAERVLPKRSAKAFNWAILDLGGTICTAKKPACERCPIAKSCDYQKDRSLPRRLDARQKPRVRGSKIRR